MKRFAGFEATEFYISKIYFQTSRQDVGRDFCRRLRLQAGHRRAPKVCLRQPRRQRHTRLPRQWQPFPSGTSLAWTLPFPREALASHIVSIMK